MSQGRHHVEKTGHIGKRRRKKVKAFTKKHLAKKRGKEKK